jgi:hypothetical protein
MREKMEFISNFSCEPFSDVFIKINKMGKVSLLVMILWKKERYKIVKSRLKIYSKS